MLQATGHAQTDKGRRWSRNEDAFKIADDIQAYVVCDGMGGHAAGDVAARMACEAVIQALYQESDGITAVRDGDEPIENLEAMVGRAIEAASYAVYAAARGDGAQAGMGSTLTMLVVAGCKAVMGHVGNSRLYLARSGSVHQLSSDHTVIAELLSAATLSPREASAHPFRDALTRAIGLQPSVRPATLVIELMPGDRFLLCTDGISDTLNDSVWLAEALEGDKDEATARLIQHADALGGRDNATAVVVDVAPLEADDEADDPARVSLTMDALQSMFLFKDLELAPVAGVLSACGVAVFQAGDWVIEEGSVSDSLIIIVDGRFEVTHSGVPLVDDHGTEMPMGPGDYVGETTLLAPRGARRGLRCLSGGSVLTLKKKYFDKLAHERPWLGMLVLRRLGKFLSGELDIARAGAAQTAGDSF